MLLTRLARVFARGVRRPWWSRLNALSFVVLIVVPSTPPFDIVGSGDALAAPGLGVTRPSEPPAKRTAHKTGVATRRAYLNRLSPRQKLRSVSKLSRSAPATVPFANGWFFIHTRSFRLADRYSVVLRI